jgi:hypothetical protein
MYKNLARKGWDYVHVSAIDRWETIEGETRPRYVASGKRTADGVVFANSADSEEDALAALDMWLNAPKCPESLQPSEYYMWSGYEEYVRKLQ